MDSMMENKTEVTDPWDVPLNAQQYISIATGILAIILNIIVLVVFLKYRNLIDNIPRLFILNQSAADACCGVLLIVAQFHGFNRGRLLPAWIRSGESIDPALYCSFVYSTWTLWCCVSASTLNLMCLNVERCVSTICSTWYGKYLKVGWIYFTIATVWIIAIVQLSWVATDFRYDPQTGVCEIYRGPPARYISIGAWGYLYWFFLPLIVIISVYTAIGVHFRRRMQKHHPHMGLAYAAQGATIVMRPDIKDMDDAEGMVRAVRQRMIRNVIFTLFLASIAYLVCFGPNQTSWFLFMLGAFDLDFQSFYYSFTVFLVNFNCAINPIIYAAKLEGFQIGLLQLLSVRKAIPLSQLS